MIPSIRATCVGFSIFRFILRNMRDLYLYSDAIRQTGGGRDVDLEKAHIRMTERWESVETTNNYTEYHIPPILLTPGYSVGWCGGRGG